MIKTVGNLLVFPNNNANPNPGLQNDRLAPVCSGVVYSTRRTRASGHQRYTLVERRDGTAFVAAPSVVLARRARASPTPVRRGIQFGTACFDRTSALTVTPRSTLNAAASALSSFSSGGT